MAGPRPTGGVGPNDPDNPNAPGRSTPSNVPHVRPSQMGGLTPKGNEPTTNKTGTTLFPGRQPGQSRVEYNQYFADNASWVLPIISVNMERRDELKGLIWTYGSVGNYDGLIDALNRGGFNMDVPGIGSSSGGRGGGGGGGGGASKDQQYAQAKASLSDQAAQLGLQLDDASLNALAKTVVDGNWSNDMVMDYLVPGAQNTTNAGSITAGVDMIKKMAADQLLVVSDATAREWSAKLASGQTTLDGVATMLQAQATARYAWAAPQIAQGISVRDLMLPSRDRIAQELEMNPEEIDLLDSKWLSMTQTTDEKGVTRAATDSEVIMRARKDPQWANTRSAAATASNVTTMLRDYFGG